MLFLVWKSLSDEDKLTVLQSKKDSEVPYHSHSIVAENFTGVKGKYVPLKETIRGFQGDC